MCGLVSTWARSRWAGCRIVRELVLGERRVDLAVVPTRDVIAIEIKSSVDRLDRLDAQVKEYGRYFPEVWIAVAPKWHGHVDLRTSQRNVIVVDAGAGTVIELHKGGKPYRDELVCSRMLELLWRSEAVAIAQRTDVLPGPVHKKLLGMNVKKLLARLLTGNEIIAEVCRELRSRPLVGVGSDDAVRAEGA